jgi:surface antigen
MAAALVGASASAAHAANLAFLRDTPVAAMTSQDNDALRKVLRDALDHKADGEPAQWSTGPSRGIPVNATVTPDHTTHDGNRTCREAAVVLNSRGQSMTLRPHFCRDGSGDWVFQKTH